MLHHGAALRKLKPDWDLEIYRWWMAGDFTPFNAVERHLLEVAEVLTQRPPRLSEERYQLLRADGWDDHAISQIVQIIAYFNYINRVMIALAVPLEEEYQAELEQLQRIVPDLC